MAHRTWAVPILLLATVACKASDTDPTPQYQQIATGRTPSPSPSPPVSVKGDSEQRTPDVGPAVAKAEDSSRTASHVRWKETAAVGMDKLGYGTLSPDGSVRDPAAVDAAIEEFRAAQYQHSAFDQGLLDDIRVATWVDSVRYRQANESEPREHKVLALYMVGTTSTGLVFAIGGPHKGIERDRLHEFRASIAQALATTSPGHQRRVILLEDGACVTCDPEATPPEDEEMAARHAFVRK